MRKLFCLLVVFAHFLLQAQNHLAIVNYKIHFNQKFDQEGSDVREYSGQLRVFNSSWSDFYMIPQRATVSTENSIEINQDTLWRVRTNLDEQELFFDDLFNEKLEPRWYADSLFPMRWTIGDETKTIDSMVCNRAETSFRGRKYIAWFTYSIALPFGPWKLGGLPGLIVSIQDDDMNLMISLTSYVQKKGKWDVRPVSGRSYEEYISKGNALRNMMKMSAQTSDCIDCVSKVKFHSWEKVFEE